MTALFGAFTRTEELVFLDSDNVRYSRSSCNSSSETLLTDFSIQHVLCVSKRIYAEGGLSLQYSASLGALFLGCCRIVFICTNCIEICKNADKSFCVIDLSQYKKAKIYNM